MIAWKSGEFSIDESNLPEGFELHINGRLAEDGEWVNKYDVLTLVANGDTFVPKERFWVAFKADDG